MEIKAAIETLVKALKEDQGYRETWKANIAVSFQDAWRWHEGEKDIWTISNKAADQFLKLLCMDQSNGS